MSAFGKCFEPPSRELVPFTSHFLTQCLVCRIIAVRLTATFHLTAAVDDNSFQKPDSARENESE